LRRVILRNSGKPELRCNPSASKESLFSMDARVISAFTRVHSPSKTGVNALNDALLPAHDGSRAAPCPSCFETPRIAAKLAQAA
jgi:hypothetical protein